MRVYVAGPFSSASFVRVLHDSLLTRDITPTSSWASEANGAEDFATMSADALRATAEQNDRDLRGSDVALLVDLDGSGRETYAEARVALEWGKPIVWVGHKGLSQWRRGVVRCGDSIEQAMAILERMRVCHASGARGFLLATMVQS